MTPRMEAIIALAPALERLGPRAFAIAELVIRRLNAGRAYGDFAPGKDWAREEREEAIDAAIYLAAGTIGQPFVSEHGEVRGQSVAQDPIVHGVNCPVVSHGDNPTYAMGANAHVPTHPASAHGVIPPNYLFEVQVCGRCHARLENDTKGGV